MDFTEIAVNGTVKGSKKLPQQSIRESIKKLPSNTKK
jgi:hypothetical protein